MTAIGSPPSLLTSPSVRPPVARRDPRVDIVHGDRRVDDYFWLRRKEDPEVTAYLDTELVSAVFKD